MPPKPASRAPRAASSSETNPFLLAIASLPLGFLASLFLLHYIGLAVELPAALFPVLDPLGHFIAPYFGRITPNILALEDTVDVKAVEGCELEPRMDACEDIEIHYPSHTAFLACADLESRVKWFPPLVKRERPSVAADPIFAYDLSAGKVGLKRLELKFPENAASRELYTHGLGIWYASKPGQGGQDTAVRLFLVNHKTTGSCISVFDHKLGSNEAIWVRDACHKLIYTPNGRSAATRFPSSHLTILLHQMSPQFLPPNSSSQMTTPSSTLLSALSRIVTALSPVQLSSNAVSPKRPNRWPARRW